MEFKKMKIRSAIYTRKATTELVEQHNSLSNQRLACEKYILDHASEGYELIEKCYEDNGFSGANMIRPGLQELFADIEAGLIGCVMVHRLDRLSRSLSDLAKIVEMFDKYNVRIVSVSQSVDTSTPASCSILQTLLNFAQYEKKLVAA